MAKKKAAEIIEGVQDLVEDAQELLDEMNENEGPGIVIPAAVIEALLVQHDTSNRVGLTSVCEQIRQMAQDQDPDKFVRVLAKP